MNMYSLKEEVCATCKYCKMKRAVHMSYIEVLDPKGLCTNKEGFLGMKTLNASNCELWKRL